MLLEAIMNILETTEKMESLRKEIEDTKKTKCKV